MRRRVKFRGDLRLRLEMICGNVELIDRHTAPGPDSESDDGAPVCIC